MEAIKLDIQTDVKERDGIFFFFFFPCHVALQHPLKKEKKIEKERRVKLSKITILFADEKKSIPSNFHINTCSLCSSRSVA